MYATHLLLPPTTHYSLLPIYSCPLTTAHSNPTAGKACTFVSMARHVVAAGAVALILLSFDYHLLSDDTAAVPMLK